MDFIKDLALGFSLDRWSLVSVPFFLFLGVAIIVFYLIPKKYQWIVLLIVSVVFYYFAAVPYTFIYLFVGILVTYYAAILIQKYKK